MKLKLALLGCLFLGLQTVNAATTKHVHPQTGGAEEKSAPLVQAKYAGFCEIEIVNRSFVDVIVSGVFDDGVPMQPFTHYSYEAPHYISLFYYGYCHYGMDLYIETYSGYPLYSGYTTRESSIRLYPYLKDQVKAEVIKK